MITHCFREISDLCLYGTPLILFPICVIHLMSASFTCMQRSMCAIVSQARIMYNKDGLSRDRI